MKGVCCLMTTHSSDRTVDRFERKNGGEGHILIEKLLTPAECGSHCRMYARVTLEPHCSLGYHEHHGESETYYILSGAGLYDDNGTPVPVEAGDVTFTPSGHGHGIANTGEIPLVFMAFILPQEA